MCRLWLYVPCVRVQYLLAHKLSKASALEVTSVSVDGEQPVLGIIRVQLSEEDNLGEVATKMDASPKASYIASSAWVTYSILRVPSHI